MKVRKKGNILIPTLPFPILTLLLDDHSNEVVPSNEYVNSFDLPS